MTLLTIISKIGKAYSYVKKTYITYHTRPRLAANVQNDKVAVHRGFKVAIVIQGKLRTDYNFTIESVKLYRKKYPDVIIIVSTWSNEKSDQIEALRDEGAIVIISDVPYPLTGFCNNNLQRISSYNGIMKAKELGADYILKCRTDQRFYENDIFNFMIKLMKLHPLKMRCLAEDRIVTISLGSFSTRIYNWSDMFTFGRANDVLRYYSCPNDDRDHNAPLKYDNIIDYCKNRPGEIYFSSHYIESLGFKLLWTFEDSQFHMKELTIIIDSDMIDLFWPKYNRRENVWRRYDDFHLKQVTFKDWLLMQ